ncbi:Rv3212 family protein [Pseudonocardia asaccharolytica]|uniref:Pyrroloquinoline-quinone binding quinoprotein n=1 Tax=Pseudonocardia asaccharolytica DSM 44247 = NBRC 16224 TaxID=1123024 RepID=A0A511D691_9PSEU|nr:hypothetical protein [Pseudonocardia asaccharolytica]GEL19973.1 hypothetical protein PA7_38100 [Pseudonocardia asaccharolytica DSM 44247 = NBRC 16224]
MPRPRPTRPERRRRGDVLAAASLVVLLVTAAVLYWRQSPAANTTTVTASPAAATPPAPAVAVPQQLIEAWRAASGATAAPLVAGPVVVTADGSTVVGRDAATGTARWSYTRNVPLCAAAEGFGRVLALFHSGVGGGSGRDTDCGDLTELDATTGARVAQRNPDVRSGTRMISDGSFVAATGPEYLEVWRSDLVKTLEYGEVRTPEQPGRQPRPGCRYGSFAMAQGRLAVLERCASDAGDRLTVLKPDGQDATRPEVESSTLLPGSGAQILVVSADRAAVVLPDPARLLILDNTGTQVGLVPIDVPVTDLRSDPPGGVAPTTSDERRYYWWTGSRTVALDRTDLVPLWTLTGTLGPGAGYAGSLLVPVPGGVQVVNPVDGVVERTIPIDRGGWTGPVALAAQGSIVLEQRGTGLAALRPP